MTLNQYFKQELNSMSWTDCCFYPNEKYSDICHIVANSKANVKLAAKAFNVSLAQAQHYINLPLINTVPGSRRANQDYCKTNKIILINKHLLRTAYSVIQEVAVNVDFAYDVLQIFYSLSFINDSITQLNIVKELQYYFQRKIKAHF